MYAFDVDVIKSSYLYCDLSNCILFEALSHTQTMSVQHHSISSAWRWAVLHHTHKAKLLFNLKLEIEI